MTIFLRTSLIILLLCPLLFALGEDISALKLSGNYQHTSLKEVLEEIQVNHSLTFSYVDKNIAGISVTATFANMLLAQAMDLILKNSGLSYKIYNESRSIVLFLPPEKKSAAKKQYTISGYIRDMQSGESLIGANIFDPEKVIGTTTNAYGFFSLTLPPDSMTLAVSYIGYQNSYNRFLLDRDMELNIRLQPSSVEGDTIQVVADAVELIENKSQMSTIDVPIRQIKTLPALLGEVDVLKTIQLLPGVQSGNEGTSGLYVRGGGPDQNLILLDGAPVYNAAHLFGFFSIFNADAINNVNLTKGGFPARYGGRLSSVVEINMKEGNNQRFGGNLTIGLVSSKFMLDGPLAKNNTSFLSAARRTYIDVVTRPFINNDNGDSGGFYFYDINAKLNHKFSNKDRLFFSIYGGNDVFSAKENSGFNNETVLESGIGWQNITSTLRWNHLFSQKLFSNTILTFSKYRFRTESDEVLRNRAGQVSEAFRSQYLSGIRDWSARIDFDYIPSPNHYIKFGANAIFHRFSPGALTFNKTGLNVEELNDLIAPSPETDAAEFSLYLEDDMKIGERLKANAGLHASMFSVNGKNYQSLQPRFSSRFLLNKTTALKASFVTMTQYIHLLTNTGIGLPTDLWVPSTDRVAPQKAWQAAVGIARSLANTAIEFSLEGYYKQMDRLIEYKDGADFLGLDTDWQNKVDAGEGTSYGAEVFIQKKRGKTTGWLGYTLSWTNRQFQNLNFGNRFAARYDRRHDFSIVASHSLTPNIEVSGNWVYGSGNAISLPTARYSGGSLLQFNPNVFFGGENGEIEYFPERNSFRMRAYHRLDLSIRFHKRKSATKEHIFTVAIYNVYNRKNSFFLFLDFDDAGNPAIKQFSLFPVVPSISYSFTF